MSRYWPHDLSLSDTESPLEILKTAQSEWESNSSGLLTLVLQKAESQTGNTMIIVHAKHVPSNRTATLLSVVHRPNAPYPVTIQTKEKDLPTFLKKTYYKPGLDIGASVIGSMQGHHVENEWVSDTPAEFRDKLETAFNLGVVKFEVLSLISNKEESAIEDAEELSEEQAEDVSESAEDSSGESLEGE